MATPRRKRVSFVATELGFRDDLGGASNATAGGAQHYVLFGRQPDARHPGNESVYFEYDDQANGGVDQVERVVLGRVKVDFSLKSGVVIAIDCRPCTADWADFRTGVLETFPLAVVSDQTAGQDRAR